MNYYISRLLLDLSEIAAALGPTKIALYFKAGVTNTAFKGASEGNLQRRLAGSLGVRGQIIAVMYVQAEDHEQRIIKPTAMNELADKGSFPPQKSKAGNCLSLD